MSIREIENYFKKMVPTFTWDKINIFCTDKTMNDTQLHISFIKRPYELYNQIEYSMCMTHYIGYIKDENVTWVDISILGNKHKILATLVYNTLFKKTAINKKVSISINICCNDVTIPLLKDAFALVFDRTSNTLLITNECPICMIDLKLPSSEKITLPCYHSVCKNCFFSSLEHNINTCPLCRHIIISSNQSTV
jgi:hypothetical protein